MTDVTELIRRYWAAAQARDWPAFAELLAPDVVYDLPQTRERIRGVVSYVEFNATYPGDWSVEVVRVIGDGRYGVSWTAFTVDGTEQPGICFFELDNHGLIAAITDFWPEPYEPPPGRDHLTQRY
jgi:hypothetical protein